MISLLHKIFCKLRTIAKKINWYMVILVFFAILLPIVLGVILWQTFILKRTYVWRLTENKRVLDHAKKKYDIIYEAVKKITGRK